MDICRAKKMEMQLSLDPFSHFSVLWLSMLWAQRSVQSKRMELHREGFCVDRKQKHVLVPDHPSTSLLIVLLSLISFNL